MMRNQQPNFKMLRTDVMSSRKMDFYRSEKASLEAAKTLGNDDPDAMKEVNDFISELSPILKDANTSVNKIK